MFRLLFFMLSVGITALSAAESTDFVPLSSKNGKLNRPILFVHGFNSDATTWGADHAYTRCQFPEFNLSDAKISNSKLISEKEKINLGTEISEKHPYKSEPYRYSIKTHQLNIKYAGTLSCADGRSFSLKDSTSFMVYDANVYENLYQFSYYNGKYASIIHHDPLEYASSELGYYSHSKSGNELRLKVLDLDKTEKVKGLVFVKTPLSFYKDSLKFKIPKIIPKYKDVKIDFQQLVQGKYALNTGFLERSLNDKHIDAAYQKATDDRVMAYRKESVPYALATMFNLNTDFILDSVDGGINDNGLYFYNSKHYIDREREGKSGCENENFKMNLGALDSVRTKDSRDHKKSLYYWRQSITFTYDQICYDEDGLVLYKQLKREQVKIDYGAGNFRGHYYFKDELNCLTSIGCRFKEKIEPEGFVFRNDSLIVEKVNWKFALNEARDEDIVSDKLVYVLNEALPTKTPILVLNPNAPPIGGTDKEPAQVNQLIEKLIRTLSEHYGASWISDPNAKIDLVGHSQGGLIIKQMFAKHTDATLKNPLNHVNKIITLNTPFNGSALATPASKLKTGHYIFGNEDVPKVTNRHAVGLLKRTYESFPELTDTKDLINGKTPIVIEGSLKYDDFLNVFASTALKAIDYYTYGLFNSNDDEIDFTINAPSVYGPYSVKIKGAIFEAKVLKTDEFSDAKKGIQDLEKSASHLAWSENSGFIDGNFRISKVRDLYNDKNIPFTTFRSEGVGAVLTNQALENLNMVLGKAFCQELSDVVPDIVETGSLINMCDNGIAELGGKLGVADEILGHLQKVISLDKEWSENGDLVVEASSQTGYKINTFFDKTVNNSFKDKVHMANQGHIPHMNGLEEVLNGAYGAAWQKQSVICELISAKSGELCVGGEVLDFNRSIEIERLLNSSYERYGVESIEFIGEGELEIDLRNFTQRGLEKSQILISNEVAASLNLFRIIKDSLSSKILWVNEKDTLVLSIEDVVNMKWSAGKLIVSVQDYNGLNVKNIIATLPLGDLSTLSLVTPKGVEEFQSKNFPIKFKGKSSNYQTDFFKEVPLRPIELSNQENSSKLMFALPEDFDGNEVGGFKIHYVIQSNSIEQPLVELNSAGVYEYYVERINDQNSMVVIEVESLEKLKLNPISLGMRWADWRPYNKENDYSNPMEGQNPKIHITSQSASVPLSFLNKVKKKSDFIKPEIDLNISKMTLEKNNSKWKISLKNSSSSESDSLYLNFLILHDKAISLDSYYGNKCSVALSEFSSTISIAKISCDKLFENQSAEIQFGIHNIDWSELRNGSIKLEEYSGDVNDFHGLIKNDYELSKAILALNNDPIYKGMISELALDSVQKEIVNTKAKKVQIRNESPSETNHLKLRLRVVPENEKTTNLEFSLNFKKNGLQSLVLEKYYIEGCEISSDDEGLNYRLKFSCDKKGQQEYWPNDQGWVIGLHHSNWSDLDLEYPDNLEWKDYVH